MGAHVRRRVEGGLRGGRARGFTLVELLVVIGLIAALISILLPALSRAYASAQLTRCASNLKQVCTALLTYATDNKGQFPPNFSLPSPGAYWYHEDRLGRYLGAAGALPSYGFIGPVVRCPDDPEGARSYAMNIWASSKVDSSVRSAVPARGTLFRSNVPMGSTTILAAEKWSTGGPVADGYYATHTIGFAGTKPGERFGGGAGINPLVNAGRWGLVNCELPFMRHRWESFPTGTLPVGRVNLGYTDGHVAAKTEKELVDSATGLSTLDSLWSPLDPQINN